MIREEQTVCRKSDLFFTFLFLLGLLPTSPFSFFFLFLRFPKIAVAKPARRTPRRWHWLGLPCSPLAADRLLAGRDWPTPLSSSDRKSSHATNELPAGGSLGRGKADQGAQSESVQCACVGEPSRRERVCLNRSLARHLCARRRKKLATRKREEKDCRMCISLCCLSLPLRVKRSAGSANSLGGSFRA
jgi:hypothetical protein